MNTFFYGVLPYIAFVVFIGGTIIRYTYFERGWTTKSSEFLSKKDLKWAGPIFHLGLLMAFGGHCMGILVPKMFTEMTGVNEQMYHMMSVSGGVPAAILFFGGFLLLMKRRFFGSARMKVNTSTMDKWLYFVLFLTLLTGTLCTVTNIPGGFDYRESIGPWFRSLLMLHPDVSLMADIPAVFQAHMFMWMMLALIFPFTRLVHCLSLPFEYFFRSHIIYRQK